MPDTTEKRYCACCGVELTRKRWKGRLEDKAVFLKRKYCCQSCSNVRRDDARETKQKATLDKKKVVAGSSESQNMTPLEHLLFVMRNDPDPYRRDKAAAAALPFCHARIGPVAASKKEDQADKARQASTGKFAAATPPKIFKLPTSR